jgi:hypothetical protein
MATIAMVITTASTALSMMKMNQAARFAACGEGWVMPMVLIKAFAMNWMSFMSCSIRNWGDSSRNRHLPSLSAIAESDGFIAHLVSKGLPESGQAHTLKDV